MKKGIGIKDIILLQTVFFIYSINSIVAKLASEQESFSFMFIVYYGLELVILYGRFHNKFSFIYLNRESMILRVSMNFKELI